MDSMKFTARRIAYLSIMTALSLIVFLIESLFPPLFIPGAKMGLSNIFSLMTVVLFSPWEALILVVIRTIIGSFFTGGISTLIYSLTAGVVSIAITSFLYIFFKNKISLISISVAAAVTHNITQNTVYCLITNTPELFVYLPYLALAGVVAGALVGTTVVLLLKYLPLSFVLSVTEKH